MTRACWLVEFKNKTINDEILNALKSGSLTEAFGAGTAATIAPISNISLNGENFIIPESRADHFHVKVLDYLSKYKRGEVQDKFNWLEVIN